MKKINTNGYNIYCGEGALNQFDFSNYTKIAILVDENKLLHKIIRPTGIPAVSLIGPDMKIIDLSSRGFNSAFDYLVEKFKNKTHEKNIPISK